MVRHKFIVVLITLLFAVSAGLAQTPSTGTVYAVGTCRPSLPSYQTISAAIAAVPAPTVVQICPGTYPEQVVITQGVTLQGIPSGGAGQVVLTFPPTGFNTWGTGFQGWTLYPQVWVNNATGPVTISDIAVDTNYGGQLFAVGIGVLFQNSAGTLNRVTVRDVIYQFTTNIGVYLEGGSSNPTVTVQNSSVHNIGSWAIYAESFASGTSLNTVLKSNLVGANNAAIYLDSGSNSTVMNNIINGSDNGILTNGGATGTVSGNTGVASLVGIAAGADGVSISGNRVMGSSVTGISVTSAAATIQGNSIINAPVGIDFGCTNNANVSKNTLSETQSGLNNVPSAVTTINTYFNVGTVRSAGTCTQ